MKCPKDNSELVVAQRHGIEIDHCPTCKGVWLDRGELDKVLEQGTQGRDNDQPGENGVGDLLGELFGGF
jgi:Zn-finger nucleic acid-binding protein